MWGGGQKYEIKYNVGNTTLMCVKWNGVGGFDLDIALYYTIFQYVFTALAIYLIAKLYI